MKKEKNGFPYLGVGIVTIVTAAPKVLGNKGFDAVTMRLVQLRRRPPMPVLFRPRTPDRFCLRVGLSP